MILDPGLRSTFADVGDRVADACEAVGGAAVPMRRLAQLLRPNPEQSKPLRRRVRSLPVPDAEPTDLDIARARRVCQQKGIRVVPKDGAS